MTELQIIQEAYKELEIERDALERKVVRLEKWKEENQALRGATEAPQKQLIAKEAEIVWLYGLVSEKEAVITELGKKLDYVQDLGRLGMDTLKKMVEAAE